MLKQKMIAVVAMMTVSVFANADVLPDAFSGKWISIKSSKNFSVKNNLRDFYCNDDNDISIEDLWEEDKNFQIFGIEFENNGFDVEEIASGEYDVSGAKYQQLKLAQKSDNQISGKARVTEFDDENVTTTQPFKMQMEDDVLIFKGRKYQRCES